MFSAPIEAAYQKQTTHRYHREITHPANGATRHMSENNHGYRDNYHIAKFHLPIRGEAIFDLFARAHAKAITWMKNDSALI
jgi:hypothetical protein